MYVLNVYIVQTAADKIADALLTSGSIPGNDIQTVQLHINQPPAHDQKYCPISQIFPTFATGLIGMEKQKIKDVFTEGAITPDFITRAIAAHQVKTHIGAHDIFLGQVRADTIEEKVVSGIDYTAYREMANLKFSEIREATIEKYGLSCLHIHHSLGIVKTGEICLFVFASAVHRKEVFEGMHYVVERLKKEVPVFGKELFEDDSYQWKQNR